MKEWFVTLNILRRCFNICGPLKQTFREVSTNTLDKTRSQTSQCEINAMNIIQSESAAVTENNNNIYLTKVLMYCEQKQKYT